MTARIWTEDEFLEVDLNDIGELESAMRFKAEHIKAKADPELFTAVAYALDELWHLNICGKYTHRRADKQIEEETHGDH